MYEIKQHYLIQLENEELRKRINELKAEIKILKGVLQGFTNEQNNANESKGRPSDSNDRGNL